MQTLALCLLKRSAFVITDRSNHRFHFRNRNHLLLTNLQRANRPIFDILHSIAYLTYHYYATVGV